MALIKYNEIGKMNEKERKEKLDELRLQLIKANVAANKSTSKTKEIKRAISRLLTFNRKYKEVKAKQKL